MGKKDLSLLILIVIVGAILRFVALTWNPPSLNWDEVSHGYNAYTILKTGMDQWGQKLPILNFRAYGDYPTTLNLYLTIPFIIILGLSEFAIRFPHALLGTLSIVSVYFLALGITKKQKLSLLAAFLVSVGPWYLFTSRFVLQSNLAVFLSLTSAALFVNRDKNKYLIYLSLVFLFLTLFAYHSTRIFSPILLLGAFLIYKNEIKNKFIYIFMVLFLAVSAYILLNPEARARSNVLFILDEGAIAKIESLRNTSELPQSVKKIVYNRPVYFTEQFLEKYISYFSPQFLFLKGGTQYQFSVPDMGLQYPVGLPFFYIGIIFLIAKALKDKNYQLLLIWLLLSPIPASLTNESYTVIRATTMLPTPEILIAMGLFGILERIPKKLRDSGLVIFIIIVLVLGEQYIVNYFTKYRTDYSWSWQYGYKEVVVYAKDHYADYDKIIITKKYGEPHEYFLFYLKYDPLRYLNDSGKIAFFQSNWWWVDHFDKFWFVNDWQIKLNHPELSSIQEIFVTESKATVDCNHVKCLLITSPDNFPPGWRKLETINFLNGSRAFEIYEN